MKSDTQIKPFRFFKYTGKAMSNCAIACDTPIRADASDAQRGEQCRSECNFWFWPFTLVFDIVSLPYRGPKHLIKKCRNNKTKPKKKTK